MKSINIYEAKTKLSQLIDAVLSGREIVIARNGKPLVKLVPFLKGGKRKLGSLKGKVKMASDFDAALPEEILKTFYEGAA